jgi:hypothetical protein
VLRWFELGWGLVWHVTAVEAGSVTVWLALERLDEARLGKAVVARRGAARRGEVDCVLVWHGGHGAFRLGLVRFGWVRRFWQGWVCFCMAWCGETWQGGFDKVWRGQLG